MNKTDFITKMLEYGSELEKTETGIGCNMIINDANILHDKYFAESKVNGAENSSEKALHKHIVNNRLYVWAIVENIVTVLAVVGLFIWTKSAWSFLLLLNINSIKTNFKKKK